MIKELLTYLISPSTREARREGYLKQSIAYQFRSQRCLTAWQPHIIECHEFVLSQLETDHRLKNIAILGSAHLLEVPILDLLSLDSLKTIFLVDIVHPRSVRALQRQHPDRIVLIEQNISGLLGPLHKIQSPYCHLSYPIIKEFNQISLDVVFSSNIWSQLSYTPVQFFSQKRNWNSHSVSVLSHRIQKHHLEWIKTLAPLIWLISDYELLVLSHQGKILEKQKTVSPTLLPVITKKWSWDLAPIPEFTSKQSLHMNVISAVIKGRPLQNSVNHLDYINSDM